MHYLYKTKVNSYLNVSPSLKAAADIIKNNYHKIVFVISLTLFSHFGQFYFKYH